MDTIVQDYDGKIDILVANAGICYTVAAEDMSTQQFRSEMGVNFDGPWFCARSAARYFKKQGKGNVIFTTSISGLIVNVPDKQAIVSFSVLLSPCLSVWFTVPVARFGVTSCWPLLLALDG